MSLQAMPTEIIDRIVSFVGSDSIMQLCHSLPELKHIYRCIYNVALAFPEFYCEGPEKLWPEFQFPCEIGYYSNKLLDIPVRHFYTIYSLTSLVSRYGGSATFSWGDEYDLVNIMPLLPKKVCITNAYDAERSKCNEAMFADLYMLKTCKFSCIQMLFLPFDHSFNTWAGLPESKKPLENLKTLLMDLNICGLSFWGAIPHFFEECVLPYMRNLTELHICDPHSMASVEGMQKAGKLSDTDYFCPHRAKRRAGSLRSAPIGGNGLEM
ncbi:hypothetical protein BDR26DRAFT_707314 [Obelidium mucronatum]|nr:hypothetical protein BDR26DRAFT_707314 [Obelidium mucronatum]